MSHLSLIDEILPFQIRNNTFTIFNWFETDLTLDKAQLVFIRPHHTLGISLAIFASRVMWEETGAQSVSKTKEWYWIRYISNVSSIASIDSKIGNKGVLSQYYVHLAG